MAGFFVQVWVLCVVAFLVGAAATWLAFVRPLRRERDVTSSWPVLHAWPADQETRPVPAARPTPERLRPPAGPPTDPALAVVDRRGLPRQHARGAGAGGALDGLAAAPLIPEQVEPDSRVDAPDIPPQSGPVDIR